MSLDSRSDNSELISIVSRDNSSILPFVDKGNRWRVSDSDRWMVACCCCDYLSVVRFKIIDQLAVNYKIV